MNMNAITAPLRYSLFELKDLMITIQCENGLL